MTHEITRIKDVCGGKACLQGTRIRVIDIVERYKLLKEQPEEIALKFSLPIEAVFSALSYYYGHLQEINGEIAGDKWFLKSLRPKMKVLAYAT